MEEYFNAVTQRYGTLTEEQKRLIRNFIDTDTGELVVFLLGPEMSVLVDALKQEAQQTQVESEFLRG
jgi:hypothetical protein